MEVGSRNAEVGMKRKWEVGMWKWEEVQVGFRFQVSGVNPAISNEKL